MCCVLYLCDSRVLHTCVAQAARALVHYTHSAIEDLKQDEDEMLRGDCRLAPSRPLLPRSPIGPAPPIVLHEEVVLQTA